LAFLATQFRTTGLLGCFAFITIPYST